MNALKYFSKNTSLVSAFIYRIAIRNWFKGGELPDLIWVMFTCKKETYINHQKVPASSNDILHSNLLLWYFAKILYSNRGVYINKWCKLLYIYNVIWKLSWLLYPVIVVINKMFFLNKNQRNKICCQVVIC